MGLFDIHCHTSESSMCGKTPAREVVDICADAGYSGICITDHYNEYHYRMRFGKNPEKSLEGYRIASEYGKERGLKVFFGIEYRFRDSQSDFLVFGADEGFVLDNPGIHEMTLMEFRELYTDLFIIQAHPLRNGGEFADFELIDAVEAINGNIRHDERNELVVEAAREHNLTMTAASDIHRKSDVKKALMDFERELYDVECLVEEIKAGRYTLIDNTTGENKL